MDYLRCKTSHKICGSESWIEEDICSCEKCGKYREYMEAGKYWLLLDVQTKMRKKAGLNTSISKEDRELITFIKDIQYGRVMVDNG